MIAGHAIQISGEGLGSLPGFDSFLSEKPDKEPLLVIDTEAGVQDWNISPFFATGNGKVFYNISVRDGVYFLRMKQLDTHCLLAEIRREGDCFHAAVRRRGVFHDEWLRITCERLFNIAALSQQTVSIHASAVTVHGKSALFLGESGTGKSTHARLWLNRFPDAELLNDDSPFIRIESNGGVCVYGSPWSGKTPCYKNLHTPVAAFVRLSQAPHNRIRRLKGVEAIGALLPSFPFSLSHEKKSSDAIHSIVSQALQQTPVYHLECLPDTDAAQLVYSTLKQDGHL